MLATPRQLNQQGMSWWADAGRRQRLRNIGVGPRVRQTDSTSSPA
jgi:hypothetical protein